MKFTYESYRNLLILLKRHNYSIVDYSDYDVHDKVAILRHDVDISIGKALEFARLENREGVRGTYFLLLNTDFYNLNSKSSKDQINELVKMGGRVGLHFDETKYEIRNVQEFIEFLMKEKRVLELVLEMPITVVSMHRPSKWILEQNVEIPGMINSYGVDFFENFKYVSDSRRDWKEDVESIITSEKYKRLHILTHAFWYNDYEKTAGKELLDFIRGTAEESYLSLSNNIRNIAEFISEEDLKGIMR